MTTRVTEGARRKVYFSFRAADLISRVSRRSLARALSSLNLKKKGRLLAVYENKVNRRSCFRSPHVKESGFRNPENFCLSFGIRNTAQRIRILTSDWNPESKFL